MRTKEHLIRILSALVNDPAATEGERAAARRAMAVHQAAADAPDGLPPVTSTADLVGDITLVFDGLSWSIKVGDDTVCSVPGCAEYLFPERRGIDYYTGETHRSYHKWINHRISAEVEATAAEAEMFHRIMRSNTVGFSAVVEFRNLGVYLFEPAFLECVIVGFRRGRVRAGREHDAEFIITAMGFSDAFERANPVKLSQLALPEGR
mgnify:CR=1 FL=1